VVVLMASCHASPKPRKGPATAQSTIRPTALRNVAGLPAARDVASANMLNQCFSGMGGAVVLLRDAFLRDADTMTDRPCAIKRAGAAIVPAADYQDFIRIRPRAFGAASVP